MKIHDIDNDTALIPEIIAESLTQDSVMIERLCSDARMFWRNNKNFRSSFKGQDERDILETWFKHWIEGHQYRIAHGLPNKN